VSGIKENKKEIILPVIFDGSRAGDNMISAIMKMLRAVMTWSPQFVKARLL
jgi:hypothetical protein